MRFKFFMMGLSLLSLFLGGCCAIQGWQADQVATAVKSTVDAIPSATPYPTGTPYPTLTAWPTYTPYPTYTPVPPSPTPTLGLGSTQISPLDGMILRYIPRGRFQMGETAERGLEECLTHYILCEDDDECRLSWFVMEEPVHAVALQAFYIDQTEVTNAQYALCVEAGVCSAPPDIGSDTRARYYGSANFADYPVININWFQAEEYCTWAGRRLPTEAEWEYAARGGLAGMLYPWGDAFNGQLANFCDANCRLKWRNPNCNDGFADTAPVGSYPPNGYGLFDMAGNVWEWVADWYDTDYYYNSPQENPTGPTRGVERVMRGGAWCSDGDQMRVAYRVWDYPRAWDYYDKGFRCAMTP